LANKGWLSKSQAKINPPPLYTACIDGKMRKTPWCIKGEYKQTPKVVTNPGNVWWLITYNLPALGFGTAEREHSNEG
jgi:hypothetical protein